MTHNPSKTLTPDRRRELAAELRRPVTPAAPHSDPNVAHSASNDELLELLAEIGTEPGTTLGLSSSPQTHDRCDPDRCASEGRNVAQPRNGTARVRVKAWRQPGLPDPGSDGMRNTLERRREWLQRALANPEIHASASRHRMREELAGIEAALECIGFVRRLHGAAHAGRIVVLVGPCTTIEELELDRDVKPANVPHGGGGH